MIIICGDSLIDFLRCRPRAAARRPIFPVPGGSCRNIAVGLGRLGAAAGFMGGISNDFFGDQIVSSMQVSGGLDGVCRAPRPCDHARLREAWRRRAGIRLLRRGQRVALLDRAASPALGGDAWRAVKTGPRELWVGGSAIQAIVGEMVFPPLLDRIVGKSGFDQQISDTPETPGRPNNLYTPVKRDVGARGRFSDKAKPRALTVDSTHLRLAAGGAVALLIGGVAALGFAAGRRA